MKHKIIIQFISKLSLLTLIGVTLMGIYIPSPVKAAIGDNLIPNPSLETQTVPGTPDHWLNGFWPEGLVANFSLAEGSDGFGSTAVKTAITTYTGEGDAKWYFEDVPVAPQTSYTFSDRYQSTIPSKVFVRYNIGKDVNNVDQFIYLDLPDASAANDWTTYSVDIITPEGTVSLSVFHALEGVGELIIDNFSLIEKAPPAVTTFDTGIITFTFDDGWKSTYDNALPILDDKGYKSTQYIISDMAQPDRLGSYINNAEILLMYANGHDIAAHSRTHTNLITPILSAAELQKEVTGSRLDLLTRLNIKPVDSLAYPYGQYDETTKVAVQQAGFIGARTVEGGFNLNLDDRYALKTTAIQRGGIDIDTEEVVPATTIEEVRSAIDSAIASKSWLIFTLHQVDNVAANIYGTSPEFFQSIVDYVNEKQAVVKTMSETLHQMPGVPATDLISPELSTIANISVPSTTETGAIVTFTAPTVTDNADPAGLVPICLSPTGLTSGSTFPLGETTVTCKAMDSSGNISNPAEFTISVIDPAAPVVTMSTTTSPTKLQALTFTFSSSDPDATLTSRLDESLFATTTSPQTLNNLTEGSHTFTVRATDSQNRTGSATSAFIVDVTKPIISLIGSSTINIALGSTYTDPGATASDSLDGNMTNIIVTGDVISSSTPAGVYSIHYDVTDRAGNAANRVTRTVIVGNGNTPKIQYSSGSYIPTYYNQLNWQGYISIASTDVGGAGNGNTTDYLTEAQMIIGFNGTVQWTGANEILYNNLINSNTLLTDNQKRAVAYFIQYGTPSTKRLGAGERAGVLNSFVKAFERLPQNLDDWEDVLKIANGRFTKNINKSAEQNALTIFTSIYHRLPNFRNVNDEAAIKLIAYGLRPGNRNLNSERISMKTFFYTFNRMPRLTSDWNIIRAIAYSGAKR